MSSEFLTNLVEWLYKAPGWALVVILSIVIGYGLRAWKSFPNGAIPLSVILVASLMNTLMAGEEPAGVSHTAWETRNATIGAILGFLAWGLHKKVIAKYEDKIPFLGALLHTGDTEIIQKPKTDPLEKPKQPSA